MRRPAKRRIGSLWLFAALCAVQTVLNADKGGLMRARAPVPSRNVSEPMLFSQRDMDLGYALLRTGSNEVHSFAMPQNAQIRRDWLECGTCTGFYFAEDGTAVCADGWLVLPCGVAAEVFRAPLALAAEFQWESLGVTNSCFWSAESETSTLYTWNNALYRRSADRACTFQAEVLKDSGDVIFRQSLPADASPADSRIGMRTAPHCGSMPESAATNRIEVSPQITSLYWARIADLSDGSGDSDGDGLSDCEELFVYGTDPRERDTDFDGLSDGEEIALGTGPLDAYSVSQTLCDKYALVAGTENPLSLPAGSAMTLLENAVYSGTAQGPSAAPSPSATSDVLRVRATGTGRGRLEICGTVIPLVPGSPWLGISVPEGEKCRMRMEKDPSIEVLFDSDRFCTGETGGDRKWIAFPSTNAAPACIHDFATRSVDVSLHQDKGLPETCAQWTSQDDLVCVSNMPPASARITAYFQTDATREASYFLSHPQYLCGPTGFVQTVRFCPQISDAGGDSSGGVFPETPAYDNPPPDFNAKADFAAATNTAIGLRPFVLLLHEESAHDEIDLVAPPPLNPPCCPCEAHRTNNVQLVYSSPRIEVRDALGSPFTATNENCTVSVRGVRPSRSYADSLFLTATNGVPEEWRNYTVLGLDIESTREASMKVFNELSASFGYPVTVGTNLSEIVTNVIEEAGGSAVETVTNTALAGSVKLRTDVFLASGAIRLAIEPVGQPLPADAVLQIWREGYVDDSNRFHEAVLLLDAAGARELHAHISEWSELAAMSHFGASSPIRIAASRPCKFDLVFEYADMQTEGESPMRIFAGKKQRITVVAPPLMPDINRDSVIDDGDIAAYVSGETLHWWVNNDTVKTEFLPNYPPSQENRNDSTVNGFYDLQNFFAASMMMQPFCGAWGNRAEYRIVSDGPADAFGYCLADGKWNNPQEIYRKAMQSVDSDKLHEARLSGTASRQKIPFGTLDAFASGCGLAVMEARQKGVPASMEMRYGGEVLYKCKIPVSVHDVEEMFTTVNIRGAETNSSFALDIPQRPGKNKTGPLNPGNFVFVHGYNMNEDEGRLWGASVFKRLWALGLDIDFTVILWNGSVSQWDVGLFGYGLGKVTPDYYTNVCNAINASYALADAVDALGPGPDFIMAHSLGNMITSSAVQDHGLNPDKYFMVNAAVPVEAYCGTNAVTDAVRADMTPPGWRDYPLRVRPAHWAELFAEGDGRRELSWSGRFCNVTNVVNFYSTEEEVLRNSDGDISAFPARTFAWAKQELFKGRWLAVESLLMHNDGGWAMNNDYFDLNENLAGDMAVWVAPTPEETAGISDAQLREMPFFGPFEDMSVCGTNGSEVARARHAYYMSTCIPAESYAAGANPLPIPGAENKNMAEYDCKGEDTTYLWQKSNNEWDHGFYINAPLTRTYEFYDDIVKRTKERKEQK